MVFLTKENAKINQLYSELQDLYKGKKILENAMHKSFYNREIYNQLFLKLNKLNAKIKEKKIELKKEKETYEKSRKSV